MPFVKGQSGNPEGQSGLVYAVKRAAQKHGMRAIEVIAELMECEDQRTRLDAAKIMLERGCGKPSQAVEIQNDEEMAQLTVPQLESLQVKLAAHIANMKAQPPVVTQ
jgi:hypothetical protein